MKILNTQQESSMISIGKKPKWENNSGTLTTLRTYNTRIAGAEDSPFRVQQLNRSSVFHTFAELSYETHLINDALASKGVSLKIVTAHNQTAYASIDVCAHSCTAAMSKTSTEPSPFFTWPLSPSKISTMFL